MPFQSRHVAVALASCSVLFGVVTACSDDDSDIAAGAPDASPDRPTTSNEAGDRCANAPKPTRSCTATACTAQAGEPAVCVDGACVKVKTEECQTIVGPIDDDDAIVLGQLIAVRGGDAAQGTTRTRSATLALDEINKRAGGLLTEDGCGRRPLAMVVCDDSNAPRDAGPDSGTYNRRAAATHLATVLKVPAILGPNNSNNTLEIATNVTIPAKTLLFPPTAGAAEITTIPGATVDGVRLVWRPLPSDALQAKAVARLGERVEADIRAANPGKPAVKVAIVNRGDAFGRGLRDGVKADVRHNNQTWAANAEADRIEREYASPGTPAAISAIATELAGLKPDIIYFFGLGEVFVPLLGTYEDNGGGGAPIWITSNSGQRAELLTTVSTRAPLRSRVIGTSSLLLTPLAQAFFNLSYKTAFPETKELSFGMTQSYDSAYLVAYALAQTKPKLDTQVPSIEVARALAKLVGGATPVDVGPTALAVGLEAMRKGEAVNFTGASGPLDFDPAVGEAPGDYAVWCIRIDPNDSKPVYENATGQKWNYLTNALEGSFACGN